MGWTVNLVENFLLLTVQTVNKGSGKDASYWQFFKQTVNGGRFLSYWQFSPDIGVKIGLGAKFGVELKIGNGVKIDKINYGGKIFSLFPVNIDFAVEFRLCSQNKFSNHSYGKELSMREKIPSINNSVKNYQ